ncbi:MAG TPA: GNAT family N-acetyltransferase [Ktedonobacterales bacterium]|nr:GNAT family N-acetyltransferase [Ktedonobacterales bacterium]
MAIDRAFTEFPVLTTERLLLRRFQPDDAEALFAILSDEDAMRFTGHGAAHSLDDARERIRQIDARYARREAIHWAVTLQGADRVIGSCSLHRIDEGHHHAETGYELHRAYWGRGIMPEAVSATLGYGFTDLGMHRIEAIIDDQNAQSKRLLLKLGFTYEGNLRQRYLHHGRFEDEYYYGLLKDEWLGSARHG